MELTRRSLALEDENELDQQTKLTQRISYNKLIEEGLRHYSSNDITIAIDLFEKAHKCLNPQKDYQKVFLIQSTIGVLYFQNSQYTQAKELLVSTLKDIEKMSIISNYFSGNEQNQAAIQLIRVKILVVSNACI